MTYFLRFTDEAEFTIACEVAGLWIADDSPRPLLLSHTHILDVIGTITEGGEWDPETGDEITPPTVLDGWHVNAKFTAGLPDGWDTYLVTPGSPVRVFAGD
jgi:hypothetical protein